MLGSPVDHRDQSSLYRQENCPREKELAQRPSVRQSLALGPLWDTELSTLESYIPQSVLRSVDDWVPLTPRWLLLAALKTLIHTVPPEVPSGSQSPCVCGLKGLLIK